MAANESSPQSTAALPTAEPPKQPIDRSLLESVIQQTSAEMQRLKLEEERFAFQQRRAKLFAASGLFVVKDQDKEAAIAQAVVRIELGESMGISPAESLQGIYIINGQTAISSAVRAARMQAAGYSWEIEWSGTEEDCTGCRLWLYYRGKPILSPRTREHATVAFLKRDAERMLTTITDWDGVPTGGRPNKKRVPILEKDNWKMSPRNMYFARAVTNAQRFYAPAVLSVNLLSVEEALDFPEEEAGVAASELEELGDVNSKEVVEPEAEGKPHRKSLKDFVTAQASLIEPEPPKEPQA